MSIKINENVSNNDSNKESVSTSDSNNNSDEKEPSSLAELQTINKYKEALDIASCQREDGGGRLRVAPSLRRCTTDENSLANIHHQRELGGMKKLSVVLIALVDQLASAYEQDEDRRRLFSQEICKSLIGLDLLQPTFLLQQMEGLRAQYSIAFRRLVILARDKLPDTRNQLPALMGPDHHLAVSVFKLNNIYKLSRYKEDFIEEEKLGQGGFGVVYRAKNKLDCATYAIKKVFVKICKEEVVLKIFREVTVFAKVCHPNIVGYKNAWLEPCVVNAGDFSDSTSTGSGTATSSQAFQSESAAADNSFSIQFAATADLSNQPSNQHQNFKSVNIKPSLANREIHKTLDSESEEIEVNVPYNVKHNVRLKNKNDLSEFSDAVGVDVASEAIDEEFSSDILNVPISTTGKQPQKARVQILEELNGTPPDWSEMERIVGRPNRLSETDNSIDFQNSLFLQGGTLSSRGGAVRNNKTWLRAGDNINTSTKEKHGKFWLGGGDTNSTGALTDSEPEFGESDSDNCKALISYKSRERMGKPQLQLECAVLFIQMDLCDQTLRDWMDERNESGSPVDEKQCFCIFQQILKAVDYLHGMGILHRDIKPRNIFVNLGLQIKLGDFGLAKDDLLRSGTPTASTPVDILQQASFSNSSQAMDHTLGVGTQGYASPEQLNSSKITQYSDMYSLGIVLYELYSSFGTNMERVDSLNHLREKGITNLGEKLSSEIVKLVKDLMHPIPEMRPSASQLLQEQFNDSELEKLERMQLEEKMRALEQETANLKDALGAVIEAKDTELAAYKTVIRRQEEQLRRQEEDYRRQSEEERRQREVEHSKLLNSKESEILYLRKMLADSGMDPRIFN